MNRADKNWAHFYKIKHFKNQKFQKMFLITLKNDFENQKFRDVRGVCS